MIRMQYFNFIIWKFMQMSKLLCNVLKSSGGENAPPPGCEDKLFFRASASCSKILKEKKHFNTVKKFKATLFF